MDPALALRKASQRGKSHVKKSSNMQSRTDAFAGIPRRDLLAAISAATLLGGHAQPAPSPAAGPLKISVFSKHFQWTNCHEMAAIARDVGFDGIDLTVREGGQVMPERVEEDLPKAAEDIRRCIYLGPLVCSQGLRFPLRRREV